MQATSNWKAPDHICESTYISISTVPGFVANTQFAQRRTAPFKAHGFPKNISTLNTSATMAHKKPTFEFSKVPLAQRGTSVTSDTRPRTIVRTIPSSTEHIKILEGMGF
ncbi:hypothetical protein FDENT_8455 [Fusarium denticulatum]|uniref:Uncharacterized protein n=1 Tax=Fusarium denticulatum TaxID=48507 RepID=A0A8H5WYE4_9HYPO|nr:hypothetical protein FDENT_8455 [Fusarium denticulatum]